MSFDLGYPSRWLERPFASTCKLILLFMDTTTGTGTWYWYTGCQKFAFCEPEEHDGVLVKHTGTGETILEKIT